MAITRKGGVVQSVYTEVTTSSTGASALIPFDDTIPQITEGVTMGLSASITPKHTTSKLLIEVQAFLAEDSDTSSAVAMAVFRDSNVNAIATAFSVNQASASSPFGGSIIAIPLQIKAIISSSSLSPTTFSVRVGLNTSNTIRWNGANGSRRFGGSLISYIRVSEVYV